MTPIFYDDTDLETLLAARRSIFLAGPTARGVQRTPWRARALELLAGFDGIAVLPEFRDRPFAERAPQVFGAGQSAAPGMRSQSYHVLHWETRGIELSTTVLFWMPFTIADEGSPDSLPGFTTRAEVSRELARAPHRIVLGMPPKGVLSAGHIRFHAHRAGLAIYPTLEDTVRAAMALAAAPQFSKQ
jgi:hypothetical protein